MGGFAVLHGKDANWSASKRGWIFFRFIGNSKTFLSDPKSCKNDDYAASAANVWHDIDHIDCITPDLLSSFLENHLTTEYQWGQLYHISKAEPKILV